MMNYRSHRKKFYFENLVNGVVKRDRIGKQTTGLEDDFSPARSHSVCVIKF